MFVVGVCLLVCARFYFYNYIIDDDGVDDYHQFETRFDSTNYFYTCPDIQLFLRYCENYTFIWSVIKIKRINMY